jgi:uncharacterized protein (TIGR03084 family)
VDEIVAALTEQQAELARLLAGLGDADWERPSPCEGWTLSDVVLHLAQTDELALASAEGRFPEKVEELARGLGPAANVDDGAGLMVERERGAPGPIVRDRWQTSADVLRDAFAAAEPRTRVVWVTGELTVRTLATTRLAETWIHIGDVAEALGTAIPPTDRLWHIARLAWRTLPYAFARAGRGELAGPVAFELQSPGGEQWEFVPDGEALTTIRGDAAELCAVAAQRVRAPDTNLTSHGPDAEAVLELVRTYA